MAGDLLYLDASALVKLVLPEPETGALIEMLTAWPQRLASDLAVVEVTRAVRRASRQSTVHLRANQVLAALQMLRIDDGVLNRAAVLEPAGLRSLDAIHLASALELGSDLHAMVVYDTRLASAAADHDLRILAPC